MEGKQPSHSEEIDLAYVFRPVTRLFQPIFDGIARHFAALKANIFLFIGLFLLISALGYCLRYVIPRSYETEGVFASRYLPVKYCELIADDLNDHVGEPALAEELHVGGDVADNIAKISLNPVTDLVDPRDTTIQSFVLHLHLRKIDLLDSIQRALVGYFDNNEYTLRKAEDKRTALLTMRTNVTAKIASLDSLTQIVNSSVIPRSTGQGIILGQPVDPVNVYKAQDSFFIQKVKIETELAHINNIETIHSFLKVSEPNYPHIRILALIAIGTGLVLAFFLTPALGKKP
jgi:hypothetical protein